MLSSKHKHYKIVFDKNCELFRNFSNCRLGKVNTSYLLNLDSAVNKYFSFTKQRLGSFIKSKMYVYYCLEMSALLQYKQQIYL